MHFTWNMWGCIDPDCSQYIRKGSDDNSFEMLQIIWLDACTEEEKKSEYVVVRDTILLSDYDDDEKNSYIVSYGYKLGDEGVDDWIIAECILEEDCMSDDCVIGEFNNREDAEKMIKKIISE